MAETSITRRDFLKKTARAAELAAWLALGGAGVGIMSKVSKVAEGSSTEEVTVKGVSKEEPISIKSENIGKINDGDELKRKAGINELSVKQTDELAGIWTRHWLAANGLSEKNYAANEKLFSKQAAEALGFAIEVKSLLRDPAVKMRLTKIAQLTDLGKVSPPSPTPERLASTERKTSFVSSFFGPQEFLNLKQSRLIRTNLAVPVVIGLIENTPESYLYSRLTGLPTGQNWNSQYNWDAFNAHVGLDAGRFLTGQKNSDVADYGPDTRGNVLADVEMRKSMRLDDRLQVMWQPFILAIRSLNYNRSVRDIEMADNGGNVTGVGWEILRRYNSRDVWKRRFTEMYQGLREFCERFPAYKWILTELIV